VSGPWSWPGRVVCVTDPQARHIHQNKGRHQDGFKARVSFEPEAGLFTAVELTGRSGAAGHEAAVAVRLLAARRRPRGGDRTHPHHRRYLGTRVTTRDPDVPGHADCQSQAEQNTKIFSRLLTGK
jgi:hypothetical protein